MIKDLLTPRVMTINLTGLENPWAVEQARTHHDSAPLIAHLRAGRVIHPEMATVIADILEGKLQAKPRQVPFFHQFSRDEIKDHIWECSQILEGKFTRVDAEILALYDETVAAARRAGFKGDFDVHSEAMTAAGMILCHIWKITPAQLDEYVNPRAARRRRPKAVDPK